MSIYIAFAQEKCPLYGYVYEGLLLAEIVNSTSRA